LITGYDPPGVYLLDPDTNTVSGPILSDQINPSYITCTVITADGKTGIVAGQDPAFSGRRGNLYFIDLSDLSAPRLSGTANVDFEPHHLCLTPDGKFGIVTGYYHVPGWGDPSGEFAPFRVSSRVLSPKIDTGEYGASFRYPAAAIAADGETVLVTNGGHTCYASVYRLDPSSGQLTYKSNLTDFLPSFSYPKLVAISPDGRTVIVDAPNVSLSILRIDSPCNLVLSGNIYNSFWPISIGFSPGGKNAYLLRISSLPSAFNQILNVRSPGFVVDSGTSIQVNNWPISSNPDTFAVEPQGRYAYVGGPSVAVIDLKTNAQIESLTPGANTISFPNPILADIEMFESVDNTAPYVEDTISFTVTAKNNGPRDATAVQVSNLSPAGLSFVSHSANVGSYDPATGLWNIGNLEQDESATLTIRAKVGQTGSITATASVWNVNEVDPESGNDSASAIIEARLRPDFSNPQSNYEAVDKAVARIGQTLTFTIHYGNAGGKATAVVITNTLDSRLENIQLLDGGTISNGKPTWNLGEVAENGSGSVRFKTRVRKGVPRWTKIVNQAAIVSSQTSQVATNKVYIWVW
jgi:uncharacterized repeat protein (TIGR01451 family)